MRVGNRQSRRAPESGVTLIEMLTALAIFSLIGVAGFALLDQSMRARGVAEKRLDRLGEIERAIFLLKLDLLGTSSVYAQTDSINGTQGWSLQPSGVVYSIAEGTLFRGDASEATAQAVMTSVNAFEVKAFPSGRTVEDPTLEESEDYWVEENGILVVLDIKNVGVVEVLSPRTRTVPPVEEGLIFQ